MDISPIIKDLQKLGNPAKIKGRAKFGIPEENSLGVTMPQLRQYGKKYGRDQELADLLWTSAIHEAKILATIIANPKEFPIEKADAWMKDLYSWDLCDQFCINVLVKTPYVLDLPRRWSRESSEFQKRAPMALIAVIAVHRKDLTDDQLLAYKPLLYHAATDPRNFVKKAVNWAVRQIGKRNNNLSQEMILFCEELLELGDKTASWIARGALRELKKLKTKS